MVGQIPPLPSAFMDHSPQALGSMSRLLHEAKVFWGAANS